MRITYWQQIPHEYVWWPAQHTTRIEVSNFYSKIFCKAPTQHEMTGTHCLSLECGDERIFFVMAVMLWAWVLYVLMLTCTVKLLHALFFLCILVHSNLLGQQLNCWVVVSTSTSIPNDHKYHCICIGIAIKTKIKGSTSGARHYLIKCDSCHNVIQKCMGEVIKKHPFQKRPS